MYDSLQHFATHSLFPSYMHMHICTNHLRCDKRQEKARVMSAGAQARENSSVMHGTRDRHLQNHHTLPHVLLQPRATPGFST